MTPTNKSGKRQPEVRSSDTGPQVSASFPSDLQQQHMNAYSNYLKAVKQGQASLQMDCATAYEAYANAVQESHQELHQNGVEAFRTYVASLQTISGRNEAYGECAEAYNSYLDSLRELTKAKRDAEQRSNQAYLAYVRALQAGKDDQETQSLAEEVRKAYIDSMQVMSSQDKLRQQAAEAQAKLAQLLHDAQQFSLKAVEDAYRAYQNQLHSISEQSKVEDNCLAATQDYLRRLQDVSLNAQIKIAEAQIKAFNALESAWQTLGGDTAK